jgi:hypothetical protein
MPTFIALPDGTVINAATIVSVAARDRLISFLDDDVSYPPGVVLVYVPSSESQGLHHTVECGTYEDACNLRDRIVAQMNEVGPIIQV